MSNKNISEKTPQEAASDFLADYGGNIAAALDAANSGVLRRLIDDQHQLSKAEPFGDTDHATLKNNMQVGINDILFYAETVDILVKELKTKGFKP